MSDNQTDSTGVAGLEGASPNSATQVQPNSFDPQASFNALKDLPEFQEFVREQASREAQSVKDRRIQKLETNQDSFSEQLARFRKLTEGGLSDEVAQEIMQPNPAQGQQPVAAETQVSPPVAPAGQTPEVKGIDYGQVLGAMGIAENDQRVTQVLRDNPNDLAAQMQAFAGLAKPPQADGQPPNQAGVLPTFQARTVSAPDLQAQYQADVSKLRQGDQQGLLDLKMQYRDKGLDVW